MDLTPQNKDHIDSLSYGDLLRGWRFAPMGDPWFQGETGTYWHKRMTLLKDTLEVLYPPEITQASKQIGWK